MKAGFSLWKIPLKNLKTHAVRSGILAVLALAQAICVFAGMMMMHGMRAELEQTESRLGADILVYPMAAVSKISMDDLLMQGTPVEVYKDKSALEKMQYCEGIKKVSHLVYISDTADDGEKIWIIGYEPDTDFAFSPWVAEGEDLNLSDGCVAVGANVKVSADKTITLYKKEWPVEAHLLETGSVLDDAIFVPTSTMKSLIQASEEMGIDTYSKVNPEQSFSVALLLLDDRDDRESVTNWINIYVRKVNAVHSEESLNRAAGGIKSTTKMMLFITIAAWAVLLTATAIILSILMKERKNEIYVWHTIGASRELITKVLLSEFTLINLMGAVVGIVIAWVGLSIFGGHIMEGFSLPLLYGLLASVVSVLATLIAGLIASSLAIRHSVNQLQGQMFLTIR